MALNVGKKFSLYGQTPIARIYQEQHRMLLQPSLAKGNLRESCFHIVESHNPSFRQVANEQISLKLNKQSLAFPCANNDMESNLQAMENRIKDLPDEWTMIHITPVFDVRQKIKRSSNEQHCSEFYLTVFDCGRHFDSIICKKIAFSCDENGELNVLDNYKFVIEAMRKLCSQFSGIVGAEHNTLRYRLEMDAEKYINNLSTLCLGEWRCLFVNRFEDEAVNKRVDKQLGNILQNYEITPSKNDMLVLGFVFRGAGYLSTSEIVECINSCSFQIDLESVTALAKQISSQSRTLNCHALPRNPLLLILDEYLEILPWEMMPVLSSQPITRMPSLHLTHALHARHANRIRNGYMTLPDNATGSYLLNARNDLPSMEKRQASFMRYWLPKWRGVIGRQPCDEEFQELLTGYDIFAYHGHGDCRQFFDGGKIELLSLNAVVFLFGCSSVCFKEVGRRCSMNSVHQFYLHAGCPTLVGALYLVTDRCTDILASDTFASWLPSSNKEWHNLNRRDWLNGKVDDLNLLPKLDRKVDVICDTNLARAISKVKHSLEDSFLTRGAFIVRGLPVVISKS